MDVTSDFKDSWISPFNGSKFDSPNPEYLPNHFLRESSLALLIPEMWWFKVFALSCIYRSPRNGTDAPSEGPVTITLQCVEESHGVSFCTQIPWAFPTSLSYVGLCARRFYMQSVREVLPVKSDTTNSQWLRDKTGLKCSLTLSFKSTSESYI